MLFVERDVSPVAGLETWRCAQPAGRAGAVWAVFAFLTLSMTEVLIGARVHRAFA